MPIWTAARLRRRCDASRRSKNAFYYSFYYSRPSRCAGIRQDTGTSPKGEKAGNALGIGLHRLSGSYGNMLENIALIYRKIYCIVTRIIFEKQVYSKFMVRMYLEGLFNDYVWKPEELMGKFSDDIELLKKIYLFAIKSNQHTDYAGNFIKYFISVNNSWVQLYSEFINGNEDGSYLHEHDRIMACWELDNYINIFDYLFDIVVEKKEYYRWQSKSKFKNLLVYEQKKVIINERKDEWVLKTVERYNNDYKKMIVLFEALSELGTDIRKKALAMFVQNNKDYENFTKLSLELNHWGGFGSMVPCMQERVIFLESLLPYLTGIDLLKHKKYIQDRIRQWKSRIEQQEIQELMESLYI